MSRRQAPADRLSWPAFVSMLKWIDGAPLSAHIEPYRDRIFREALDTFDPDGRPSKNIVLCGRSKKNWKTADLVLAALFALVNESPLGHDAQCYLLANDADQARDDLALAKKVLKANPGLGDWLRDKRDLIERKDGRGFLEILPSNDVAGAHGKTYRFCGYDEIHGYRTWDIFEAMQPDPHRLDAQQWITSYASLFHRPGVPLFDLMKTGRMGTDPRMLFSWFGGDFATDPEFAHLAPELRANPSSASWADAGYLEQQRRRLPAHKYRRLHLNLAGVPEGSAYQAEPIIDAVERGTIMRTRDGRQRYVAFVDMSGGSSDDAVLCVAHADADGRAVIDLIQHQGQQPPFDPCKAVARFAATLKAWHITRVTGDAYAGETFRAQFQNADIAYSTSRLTKSDLYDSLEPQLNSGKVVLLDVPVLEQQLLGLIWRGGKIDHPSGEHDDFANAAAGAIYAAIGAPAMSSDDMRALLTPDPNPDPIWGAHRWTPEEPRNENDEHESESEPIYRF